MSRRAITGAAAQLAADAVAAILGEPYDVVEARRRRDLQPSHRKREPEVLLLRDRLDEARGGAR